MEQIILYFDIINGISGDMILATLLNLGVPEEIFLKELSKLNLDDEFDIKISSKFENGIKGTNVDVIINEENIHRYLVDIFSIIDNSSLNDNLKDISKKVFMVIGEAEAKVHGTTIDKIHFHEVGAIDSIIDIVETSILIDLLCIDKIYASTVPVGCGFVNCNNGIIPVPASSTLEILKDIPIKLNSVKGECTTPTGAAILKVLCDEFIDTLEFEPKQIGYGIGDKTFELPNILRSILGVKKTKNSL